MKNAQKIDLGLTGYDELFMNEAERKENKLPRIYDIPISEIDDFPDHPFKVKIDEDMDQLVQSIKERGIITPVTLRPKEDGRYEIVSGHRRKKACELAGFETVKAEVREMTRDEAIILMVESNLQRSTILPSEKAFSYKMRLEAMKRQVGRPSLENGSPMDNNLRGVKTASLFQESTGDGQAQVYRYIRLTELIPELLDNPVFQKPSKVYLIQGFVFLIIAIALLVFGLWASSTGGIVFVGLGVFVFVIAVVSFNEHKKAVHKHHLANTDYAAYEEYIKNEREKERETQEFLQKQKDEKEAKKYNNYKYKCPMCGSNKIANISTAKKVVSAELLGLASDKIGKTYQCDECKYMW